MTVTAAQIRLRTHMPMPMHTATHTHNQKHITDNPSPRSGGIDGKCQLVTSVQRSMQTGYKKSPPFLFLLN